MSSFYCKQPYADEQVRAIIEGRKTLMVFHVDPEPEMVTDKSIVPWEGPPEALQNLLEQIGRGCKYKVGERYWLKEAWGKKIRGINGTPHESFCYRADNPREVRCYDMNGNEYPVKWQQSIHMPQWASRFTMEVTRVYVKRVRDVTNKDASLYGCVNDADHNDGKLYTNRYLFEFDWPEDSWQRNDWCWFVEFKGV